MTQSRVHYITMKYLMREYYRHSSRDSHFIRIRAYTQHEHGKMLALRDVINGKIRRNACGILNDIQSVIAWSSQRYSRERERDRKKEKENEKVLLNNKGQFHQRRLD